MKTQEYVLVIFGLAAVVAAFFAILWSNYTLAITGGGLAIVAMLVSIAILFTEEKDIEDERSEMAKQRKSK